MKKPIGISLLYAAIIFLVFGILISSVSVDEMTHISDNDELSSFDFGSKCAVISDEISERYNDKLLTPSEIDGNIPDKKGSDFEYFTTYRFRVPVSEGVNYGISCRKSDYAVNIYVDGKQIVKTGNVSDKKENFVPTASAYEAFFTGNGNTAEIVIQQANFNHHKHYPVWFRLGPAEKISRYNRQALLKNVIISVVLLTAALMNIGMFLCFTEKKEILWFSIICLMASVNTVFPDVTAFVSPGINWYVSHKIETCSMIALMLFSLIYAKDKFEEYINIKSAKAAIITGSVIFALFALTPPSVYTRCNEVSIIVIIVCALPMIVLMAKNVFRTGRKISQSNKLAFIGIIFLVILAVNDGIGYGDHIKNLDIFGTTTGVSLFAFFNSLALAIDFRTANEMLEQSKARENELAQTNEAMMNLSRMRDSFLADLSHELKTPLTVIGSISSLAAYQMENGIADDKTTASLKRNEDEAVRLGEMVERLKLKSINRLDDSGKKVTNLHSTLTSGADFCDPVCRRRGNRISVQCADDISIDITEDLLFHCLYNLIANANRHCENNIIELIGKADTDYTEIKVIDHGDGMSEENMKSAFDRGYSGDSGSGIGLALCREIAEYNNGTITLGNTEGGGLTVTIKFRRYEYGQNSDN